MDTERTPLLHDQTRSSMFQSLSHSLPCINELEHTVYADTIPDFGTLCSRIEASVSLGTSPEAELIKSTLVLLLLVRYFNGYDVENSMRGWLGSLRVNEEWKQKLSERWVGLQKVSCDEETFFQLLTMPFRVEGGVNNFQTVLDAIVTANVNIPLDIGLDGYLASSLLMLWRSDATETTSIRRIPSSSHSAVFLRLEQTITPRALHLIDLIIQVFYFFYLHTYIVDPPSQWKGNASSPSHQSVLLMIYSLSRVLRDHWSISIPYYVVLAGFSAALPCVPQNGNYSFSLLVTGYCICIIQLLLPVSASPSLLFPNTVLLTLSSIMQDHIARVYIPVILFFLPTFLIAFFFLSLFGMNTPTISTQAPIPEVVNIALQLVLLFLMIFFITLVMSITISTSTLPPDVDNRGPSAWKRYGPRYDILTRQNFYRAILKYSSTNFCPAPLNLLYCTFVMLPTMLLRLIGRKTYASEFESTFGRLLHRILILPLTIIISVVWLWRT